MKKDINELITTIIQSASGGRWEIVDFHAALIGALVSVEAALAKSFLSYDEAEESTDNGLAFERKQAKMQMAQHNN